ncbi:YslB family protein [Ligilactobacillus ceti]|uniref:DUF2507 domain-containing protein n=1 Tax=Ligilactobacillus ceti DSM 22408 TaxID=1122146 RepID=A0A0R2KIB9_9LACO|nr:YslB family protein [Ligilactobacillus ceti]KRN89025.1 hypothetical protein IV53_GL000998 [Ligilactobacillus ceti DSM 22408]
MPKNLYNLALENNNLASTFGLELLRDILIPDILGEDNHIAYWAGKKLARDFALAKDEELPIFFKNANWGILTRTKHKKGKQYFSLTGDIVALRLNNNPDADFSLEAGFLAATIEQQIGFVTEAIIEKRTKDTIEFFVQVDLHDPLDLAE